MGTIPERIQELIALMLDKEQTPDEEREFKDWLTRDPANEALWRSYRRLREEAKLLKSPFQPAVEPALQAVKQKKSSRFVVRRMIGWAAVLVFPLSVGLWLLSETGKEDEMHRRFSQVAHPGSEKAILKINNRDAVYLGQGLDTLIITGNGAKIQADSGNRVSYVIDPAVPVGKEEENQLIVPRGGEYRLTLSDGTKVWLNSSSVLTFPTVFAGDLRRVQLTGEAFFEVSPDAGHPFIVVTPKMDVKVLGTSFNVSVYEDEEAVHTTLLKGRVEVRTGGGEPCELKPGEQAYLTGGKLTRKEVNMRQFTSWINGKFMFFNTPLEEISKQISRWYDVDIFFSREEVKEIRFTGAMLRFEPLEELIRMIESTSNVRFSVKNKTIVISEL